MVSSTPEAFAAIAHGLAARLALRRPLAFIDLETTGLSTQEDRIVQMAVLMLSPGGECTSRSTLVDPGVPIPPAATAVHGISDEQVAGQPRFAALAAHDWPHTWSIATSPGSISPASTSRCCWRSSAGRDATSRSRGAR